MKNRKKFFIITGTFILVACAAVLIFISLNGGNEEAMKNVPEENNVISTDSLQAIQETPEITPVPETTPEPVDMTNYKNTHEGEYSLVYTYKTNMGWDGPIQTNIKLEKDKKYTFSAWVKGKGNGNVGFILFTPDWSGNIMEQFINIENGWNQISFIFTPPSNGNYHFKISGSNNYNKIGTIYIDELYAAYEGGENVFKNPGFENGSTSWNISGDFAIMSPPDDPVVDYSTAFTDDFLNTYKTAQIINMQHENHVTEGLPQGGGRLVRAGENTNEASVTYLTTYPAKSFQITTYYWADIAPPDLEIYASVTGKEYELLSAEKYEADSYSGVYPVVIYEGHNLEKEYRLFKIVMPYKEGVPYWAHLIKQVKINSACAPVNISPDPGKITDKVQVSLSTDEIGADIWYSLGKGHLEKYIKPFEIEGFTTIEAYSFKNGKENSMNRKFTYTTPAEETIDKWGQFINKAPDHRLRIKNDEELKDDIDKDKIYYQTLKDKLPGDRDLYGGWTDSQKLGLTATGFFHIEHPVALNGKAVMVDPLGNMYFSLGVNSTAGVGDTYTLINGREYIYNWIPKPDDQLFDAAFLDPQGRNFSFYIANKLKKDPSYNTNGNFDHEKFYFESVDRLKLWGFNSEGYFSYRPEKSDPYFPKLEQLPLPWAAIPGSSLYDIYKSGIESEFDRVFNEFFTDERINDSNILGYLYANEIDYGSFNSVIPAAKASETGTKRRLVDTLKEKYVNIADFNKAWNTSFTDFNKLYEASLLTDGSNINIKKDMDEFFRSYIEDYYSTIRKYFDKYDKKDGSQEKANHILMGDRWLASILDNEALRNTLSEIAGKYLDALSYNYYADDPDVERLQKMYEISGGTPLILTEYHYGDSSTGLESGILIAKNEKEKGEKYSRYVQKAAASGCVVGAHWFMYLDQSATGRWYSGFNGECGAIGLINVADRPYTEFLEQVTYTNNNIYKFITGEIEIK